MAVVLFLRLCVVLDLPLDQEAFCQENEHQTCVVAMVPMAWAVIGLLTGQQMYLSFPH